MTYPIYVEYALGFRKIENEETYTAVNDDTYEFGIVRMNKAKNIVNTLLKNGTKVSEACFNNAFQNALTKLNQMIAVNDWEGFSESKTEGRELTKEDLKAF